MTTEERLAKIEADIAAIKSVIPTCLMFASKAATLAAVTNIDTAEVGRRAQELVDIANRISVTLDLDRDGRP
jgi:hypothetical protein